jgi:acetylglutamate kinase
MKLAIIKIGGHVIDNPDALKQFLKSFSTLKQAKILIHGGGKIASVIGEQMGIAVQMHEGRRITDESTRDLVTMVYGGLLNKKIVAELQSLKVNAIGLSGADGNLLKAKKRPIKTIDYGFVGDIKPVDVNVGLLNDILLSQMIPVIPALTHDQKGSMLNTNADTMASVIAQAMQKDHEVQLAYCFEHSGVMINMAKGEIIDKLTEKAAKALHQEGIIQAGMLPKLHNAFDAAKAGVKVGIGHFENLEDMLASNEKGTTII